MLKTYYEKYCDKFVGFFVANGCCDLPRSRGISPSAPVRLSDFSQSDEANNQDFTAQEARTFRGLY